MKNFSLVAVAFLLTITIAFSACNQKNTSSQSADQGSKLSTSTTPLDEVKIRKVAEDFALKLARGNKNAEIKVLNVEPSVIQGVAKVRVEWKQNGYGKRFDLYVTNDGKYVFMGPIVPINSNLAQVSTGEEDFVDEKMINTQDSPAIGPKDAPVRIVEFSDFQCPYCKKLADELDPILQKYKGKIRLTFKHFPLPFHPWAKDASIAAICAYKQKPEAFWDFYKYYYGHQQEITAKNVKEKSIELAEKIGLDLKKFKKCLNDPATEQILQKDQLDGRKLQVRATPTLYINGLYIPGAIPQQQLESIIQKNLKK
jgi:protein-disulfide isomerase